MQAQMRHGQFHRWVIGKSIWFFFFFFSLFCFSFLLQFRSCPCAHLAPFSAKDTSTVAKCGWFFICCSASFQVGTCRNVKESERHGKGRAPALSQTRDFFPRFAYSKRKGNHGTDIAAPKSELARANLRAANLRPEQPSQPDGNDRTVRRVNSVK
jgi:hypothetical protein